MPEVALQFDRRHIPERLTGLGPGRRTFAIVPVGGPGPESGAHSYRGRSLIHLGLFFDDGGQRLSEILALEQALPPVKRGSRNCLLSGIIGD